MRVCAKCGADMPLENRRGPRRKMCQRCSPSRGAKSKPVATILERVEVGCVVDATKAELQAAGAMGTALGQSALALARAIDSGDERGTALASLAKQHAALLMACAPKAEEASDPLQQILARDELAQRRDRLSG